MTIRSVAVVATSLLAALVLTGCGAASTQAAPASHNDADVAFAQGMIPHHTQAVDMARLAAGRAGSADVRQLADGIERAQDPEIRQLRGFLAAWGAPETGMQHGGMEHGGMDHGGMEPGGGMMDDGRMAQLGTATGAEFDRLFLAMMIEHHEGAVRMAGTELGSGADPGARALAQRIVDTQRAEIDRMRGLLG